jgi:hypothetical protein
VKGTTKNCGGYDAHGLCLICKEMFIFNDNLTLCVPAKGMNNYVTFICPDSSDEFYEIKYLDGNCIKISKNCDLGGYGSAGCFKCIDGYYL